jgi:hypothetical protein
MTKADKAIEQLICKRWPGAKLTWVRINDGLPQRAAIFLTDIPLCAPCTHEFKDLNDGRRYKIQVLCRDNGYALVTWGHVANA